jgi:hypothetical protein
MLQIFSSCCFLELFLFHLFLAHFLSWEFCIAADVWVSIVSILVWICCVRSFLKTVCCLWSFCPNLTWQENFVFFYSTMYLGFCLLYLFKTPDDESKHVVWLFLINRYRVYCVRWTILLTFKNFVWWYDTNTFWRKTAVVNITFHCIHFHTACI